MKLNIEHSADKVLAPAAVATFTLFGLTLSDISYLATALYAGSMFVHFAATKWVLPLIQRMRGK